MVQNKVFSIKNAKLIISCILLLFFTFTLAFVTPALGIAASEDNLVANPGFDNATDGMPLNWTFVSGAGTVVYDAAEGYDSPGSVRIDVPGTEDATSGYPKSDLIEAEPDTLYTFSAWGKSSGVGGIHAPAVRVMELNSSGGWITQHNLGFSRDSDWEQKQTTFTTNPDASKLYVYANIWESYGTFWVDDIYLSPTSSESTANANPPASITNLRNTTGQTWINWTWTNPKDASFNHTMVYLNGIWQTNTSNPFYNATELNPDTYYEIATHTIDIVGNINTTGVNQTTKTKAVPDVTPPASITNLQNRTGNFWINWTWTNPGDADFNHTMVYIDGTFETNTSDYYYNKTNLNAHNTRTISTHTVDTAGNVNSTWVNQTTTIPNNEPVLSEIGEQTVEEGTELNHTITASNLDDDSLTFSDNKTSFGMFTTINDTAAYWSWTPGYDDVGVHYVDFGVSDGYGGVDNETVKITVSDVTAPASITNLANTTGNFWINWTWTNPGDADFNHTMVFLNGTWEINTSDPFYNATGLAPDTSYEIGTHTAGEFGNVNETWVNQTVKTRADTTALDAVPKKILHATEGDFDAGTKKGVEVQKHGVITLERKNLLNNPSFETELAKSTIKGLAENWWIYNPSGGDYTTLLDTNVSTSGSRSQKIIFSSNSTQPLYLGQTLHGVENNTDYTFSADVKIDNPENVSAKLLIQLWCNGKYITGSASAVTESTSFTRLTKTVTTTSDTDEIRAIVLLITKFSSAAGAMWVDSAMLEKNNSPTPYAPGYATTSGEYISPPIDFLGENTTPYKIEWTSSVKPEGDIRFQIRSASSLEELNNSPWYGPASTEDYYAYRSEGDNLLLNPSLESDSNSNGIPDNSRHMGWGTNDANFTAVNDAYEGEKAVKVEITNYTSGDRRWEILYDGIIEKNSCYLFDVWHKENGNIGDIRIAVSVEKPDGSTSWGYSGRRILSSTDWKHDKLFFCTPDYEVKKIWLELVLAKEGCIISDAYSLKKVNFHGDEWKINPVHINSRWIQYKVNLSTTDQTYSPSLHDVTIKYGASVPEIQWANVLADDSSQKYAFQPGETANFKVEVLDFRGITNIEHVNISIFDTSGDLVLQDTMTEGADVRDVKRYYEYQYSFPDNATIGVWKANIIAVNKEGQNYTKNIFLKMKEPYSLLPQKMTLGALAWDYGFKWYSVHEDIEKYSKYTGLEIWKVSIGWERLEPEHGSFDESYVNNILEFMDGAHDNGAKVQIGIAQQWWPVWVNNGDWDDGNRYGYEQTARLADTWMRLAERIKDHPALDSYLIINEENHVYDADIYLRGLNKIASSIRTVDSNLNHRITIRPNTQNSYIRTRIAQDGIQEYDYGTGGYPTSSAWYLTNYENPISATSYLRMSRLRSSSVAYGCAGGVGEIGFFKAANDSFGDDEKLAGFERAMSIAYDQGMDEFMLWEGGFTFADPETYFPKLKAFRDELVTQPRSNHFDVRILIDNNEWFYTSSGPESALDMSNQPYKHLVETLDEGGYSWFYTHPDAVSLQLQDASYNTTLKFSDVKNKNATEIRHMLTNVTPTGKRYPWVEYSEQNSSINITIAYSCNETGIAGVTVNLTKNRTLIASTTTDSSGNCTFTDIPPGDYNVTASKIRFWSNFTPVTVNADHVTSTIINLTLWLKGDLKGDRKISEIDLALMRDAVAGKGLPIPVDWKFDLNSDGEVSEIDLALMRNAIAGIPIP